MADAAAATTASEQARARKERREAKLRAAGSARLSKITGMAGRGAASPEPAEPPAPDPEVVDISRRGFTPPAGADQPAFPADNDPLARAMAQMIGGAPGPLPPGLAGLFPPQAQAQAPPQAPTDRRAAPFRAVHALLGLGLGLYVALLTPFAGTSAQRERAALDGADADDARRRRVFFWIFATGEALLLTTRFFLDKGGPPSAPGMLWSLAGHLGEPWRGHLTVGLRYALIFTTVRADMLMCIFVLGVCAWSKS